MNRSELNITLSNGNHHTNHFANLRPVMSTSMTSPTSMNQSQIPVARTIPVNSKLQDRIAGLRSVTGGSNSSIASNNSEQQQRKSMSVAAQRAAFEKLDAAAATAVSSVSSPSGGSCNNGVRTLARTNSYQSPEINNSCVNSIGYNNCLREKSPSIVLNRSNSFQDAAKWKSRFEEAEKKRKMLLQKSESGKIIQFQ